jgi:RNA polymerase sigma-70 factor (ECF subfamily)
MKPTLFVGKRLETGAQITNEADLALASAVLARDRKATARFVALHSDAVYRFVWRRLAPRADEVDDLVQDIFLAGWRALDNYKGASTLEAWVLGIARHKVEDYYRRILAGPIGSENLEGDSPSVAIDSLLDEALDDQRQAEHAAAVLSRMQYNYAILLKWRYWDDRPAREMATAMGKTEKAVERMLARARKQFAAMWLDTKGR